MVRIVETGSRYLPSLKYFGIRTDWCGMDFSEQRLTLDQIRELDMVDYLASLGHQPEAIKKEGTEYWYLSPLRIEGEASFKVNQVKNRWLDFGLYQGGNLIDFSLLYFNCTIPELVDKFNGDFSLQQLPRLTFDHHEGMTEKEVKMFILGDLPISSYPLKNYLQERRIPLPVARQFCTEVSYELDGHSYYGIGFKNDAGGFEVRNKYCKLSSSPKDITTLRNASDEVHIFEGFFDFLSFKAMYRNVSPEKDDCIILNGAGMFDRARPAMIAYKTKHLWLDRDTTGLAYTKYALSLNEGFRDESALYAQHKDLNDWLSKKGLMPKKRLRQRIS